MTHAGDLGEVNEQHFIDFLRAYLPNRYTAEKASVIDSQGQVSHSIDMFDRPYTPTLLNNDQHHPAEAVYAVFECKPRIDRGHLEFARLWPKLAKHLGRRRAFWEFLLDEWWQQGRLAIRVSKRIGD